MNGPTKAHYRRSLSNDRSSGFTLIELLTVIAVIAILAAILIPSISKVRERSNLTKSVANVRSIGQATLLYSQENNGEYPVWYDYSKGQYWWAQLLPSLSEDKEIFGSPAHDEFNPETNETLSETISYGWNYVVMGRHKADTSYSGDHVLNQFNLDPSQTLIVTDGPRTGSWGYIDHVGQFGDETRYGNNELVALFLDGRVETKDAFLFRQIEPYFNPVKSLPPTL